MPSPAPLVLLRRFAAAAPWSSGELVALVDALLTGAGRPAARPMTERTLHYHVREGVVQPPFGHGGGSRWGYPHLVELLAARLAQREGARLAAIASHRATATIATLEAEVAAALGATLPEPVEQAQPPRLCETSADSWREFALTDGMVVRLRADHPLLDDPGRLGALLAGLTHEAVTLTRESSCPSGSPSA